MNWFIIGGLILGTWVVGWFTTAIVITQIGLVKRGCVSGCQRETQRDHWGEVHAVRGTHAPGCGKPHLELTEATEAALMAIPWPYVLFHSLLVLSESNAKKREVKKSAAKRPPVDEKTLDAVLYDEKKTLELPE